MGEPVTSSLSKMHNAQPGSSVDMIDLTTDGCKGPAAEAMAKIQKSNNQLIIERRFLNQKLADLAVKLTSKNKEIERLKKGFHSDIMDDEKQELENTRLAAIIDKLVAAVTSTMNCSIGFEFSDTLFILNGCGHAFSEWGLHGMLQAKVMEEHTRLETSLGGFTLAKLSGAFPYNAAKLRKLRRRSVSFAPVFVCPLCREPITVTPVECLPLRELGAAVKRLTNFQGGEVGNANVPFPCKLSDYFIFPQPVRD